MNPLRLQKFAISSIVSCFFSIGFSSIVFSLFSSLNSFAFFSASSFDLPR